jgi:hypothetical protein
MEASVMYLTGSVGKAVEPALDAGIVGYLRAPGGGRSLRPGWTWAADNGVFGKGWPGEERWLAWLDAHTPEERTRCLFATAPDVVGDHDATLARSLPWLARIRELGYPAAFVLQNGATVDSVPWDDFDVAFVGGDDAFKLGGADDLIREAQRRGKRVHVGRVNSGQRYQRFALMGVDSADGTFLAFGPDTNLPKLLSWVRKHATHQPLWAVMA